MLRIPNSAVLKSFPVFVDNLSFFYYSCWFNDYGFYLKSPVQSIYVSTGGCSSTLDSFSLQYSRFEVNMLKKLPIFRVSSFFVFYLLTGFLGYIFLTKRRISRRKVLSFLGVYSDFRFHLDFLFFTTVFFSKDIILSFNMNWYFSKNGLFMELRNPFHFCWVWGFLLADHWFWTYFFKRIVIRVFWKLKFSHFCYSLGSGLLQNYTNYVKLLAKKRKERIYR